MEKLMKIPENFKQKYHLTGESYDPANVDAALSELFAVSSRLYKENADLKAEIARLQEESEAPAGAQPTVDLSGVEAMIICLEQRLSDIKSTVNDTLCIANDAAISAKRAEEGALEAKKSAADACAAAQTAAASSEKASESALEASIVANDVLGAAKDIGAAVAALDSKLDGITVAEAPAAYDEASVEEIIAIANEAAIEALEEYELSTENEPAQDTLDLEVALDLASEQEEIAPELPEEEKEIDLLFDISELDAESEEKAEEAEAIEAIEEIEEIEKIIETEEVEEAEEPEKIEEVEDIAEDLIKTAGLDGEVEEIEPAEEVSDDDLTKKLAEMYSAEEATEEKTEEAPAEEEKPEEKPAPTSFNDMKSALDAIRARLKK